MSFLKHFQIKEIVATLRVKYYVKSVIAVEINLITNQLHIFLTRLFNMKYHDVGPDGEYIYLYLTESKSGMFVPGLISSQSQIVFVKLGSIDWLEMSLGQIVLPCFKIY